MYKSSNRFIYGCVIFLSGHPINNVVFLHVWRKKQIKFVSNRYFNHHHKCPAVLITFFHHSTSFCQTSRNPWILIQKTQTGFSAPPQHFKIFSHKMFETAKQIRWHKLRGIYWMGNTSHPAYSNQLIQYSLFCKDSN